MQPDCMPEFNKNGAASFPLDHHEHSIYCLPMSSILGFQTDTILASKTLFRAFEDPFYLQPQTLPLPHLKPVPEV